MKEKIDENHPWVTDDGLDVDFWRNLSTPFDETGP